MYSIKIVLHDFVLVWLIGIIEKIPSLDYHSFQCNLCSRFPAFSSLNALSIGMPFVWSQKGCAVVRWSLGGLRASVANTLNNGSFEKFGTNLGGGISAACLGMRACIACTPCGWIQLRIRRFFNNSKLSYQYKAFWSHSNTVKVKIS